MKRKVLSLFILSMVLFSSACASPGVKEPEKPAEPTMPEETLGSDQDTENNENADVVTVSPEESIVYENDVVETINKQMEGLPIEQIRAKAPLIMEKSTEDIQTAIKKGELSYTELVAFYLDRIKVFDKSPNGLNAVMAINPNAIAEAQKLDATTAKERNPIYGMPVLIKDNINTKDMPTSGGIFALKDFQPTENAPVVESLIKNKAIILGKANLSELAHFFDVNMPAGYSPKIGQTRNPFGPGMISPMGSSSGSGAAVAANFAVFSLGTETSGSIMAPSYIHSIVGFKPTKGLISTEGILPLSSTLDTVGPMAKSVADAVVLFNYAIQNANNKIYLTMNASDIAGKRIGVLKDEESASLVEVLKKVGAIPVEIDLMLDDQYLDDENIMLQDFARDFAAYAQKFNAPIKTLAELVKFNQEDMPRRAKYGQGSVEEAANMTEFDRERVQKMVDEVQSYIKGLMTDHQLDALAFVNSNFAPLPCIAGYPEITVPMGQSEWGDPMGATFFGLGGEDAQLVNIAYAFEQASQACLIPEAYLENAEK